MKSISASATDASELACFADAKTMSVRPADMEERARLLTMSVAATSIADTAGFLTDLHKRIDESILRAVWVLPRPNSQAVAV